MEKYLIDGEPLTQEELETLLDKAIAQGIFVPVFVGSAIKLQGIEDLMDEIVAFFPSPRLTAPSPPPTAARWQISADGETVVWVFKTMSDPTSAASTT